MGETLHHPHQWPGETKQRYFGNPLNINELLSSETALGLPSSHRQIADFRKHADFWESRQPNQYIVYWTHRKKNMCKPCAYNSCYSESPDRPPD